MLGFLSKLFGGSKSEKDVKSIQPIVANINEFFQQYQSLSIDELRVKTSEFKQRIQEHLRPKSAQIETLIQQAEQLPVDQMSERDAIYQQIDELKKEKNKELEVVLKSILPEAFAVVKEASRRFKEMEEITASATELDRTLAVTRPHIRIEGDKVVFKNKWLAAGNEVLWNMVHYDVQLIGGAVLHDGKIAEMATGEGKTLVSTLPAYLNALAGEGVHIVTVNDYLSKRDS